MFADDSVLLADTSEGLQQSLSVVQEYGKEWQLKIKLLCSKAPLSSQVNFYIYVNKWKLRLYLH